MRKTKSALDALEKICATCGMWNFGVGEAKVQHGPRKYWRGR
jgi:hypothetical protein